MTIRKIDLSRLHNGEHFTFHTTVRDMIVAATPAALRVEALWGPYTALYADLDTALKKITKSEQTARVNELDAARDSVFRGLVDTVNGFARHFNPEIAASARRILIVTNTYDNVASMSLDDETAMLYNLCKDLAERCADDVTALGLGPWIQELDRLNRAVQEAMAVRVDEVAGRTTLVLRVVRGEIDRAYRDIARRVDALQEVAGDEAGAPWAAFIAELNAVIERADNIASARIGMAKAKKEKEEAEKPQPKE